MDFGLKDILTSIAVIVGSVSLFTFGFSLALYQHHAKSKKYMQAK